MHFFELRTPGIARLRLTALKAVDSDADADADADVEPPVEKVRSQTLLNELVSADLGTGEKRMRERE